jgi:exopolysaccharide biosynthesis polyprenyl glycosylphosphotransferase
MRLDSTASGRKAAFRLSALRAQRLLGLFGFSIAPAAAAGLMAAGHLSGPRSGALVFATVLAANLALVQNRPQLQLMPLASSLVRALSPVVGAALALALFGLLDRPVPAQALIAPVVGAWLVTAFAAWVKLRFDGSRPVRIAIIGSPTLAIALADELANAGVRGHSVVGWIADDRPTAEPGGGGPRRLGSLGQIGEVVERHSVDLLAHSNRPLGEGGDPDPHPSRLDLFERVAADCLDMPVRLIEVSQLYEELLGHVPIGQSNAAWFQYLLHPRYRAASTVSKRLFDLVASSVMLVLAAPVLAAFAVAVKLTDGGPVLYRQRRVGEHGREFGMIKLRSMEVSSEREGPRWSEEDDERVTAVGKLMRKFHVDELPQLWNILRGEMTLVGPRPERRELIDSLEFQHTWYDRRHLVKPGLAGWAQARCGYGGSQEGTSWKLCHDLYYLKHRSVYLDALVLAENFRVAMGGSFELEARAPQPEFILDRPVG